MPADAAKQLSLDTNVLIDLGNGEPFADRFRRTFQARGYSLCIVPRVLAELHIGTTDSEDPDLARACKTVLQNLGNWKIEVRKLEDLEERWKANFLDICAERRLLPPKEKNDAHIIAETAVARIPILVTSDGPLLRVDTKELNIALADGGLHGVQIMGARLLGAPRPQPTKVRKAGSSKK